MLEKLEAEKAKDDEKEKEAMKSEKLFQKTLLMLQARSMGIDVNDLMQLWLGYSGNYYYYACLLFSYYYYYELSS